jgi:hypothetical protein
MGVAPNHNRKVSCKSDSHKDTCKNHEAKISKLYDCTIMTTQLVILRKFFLLYQIQRPLNRSLSCDNHFINECNFGIIPKIYGLLYKSFWYKKFRYKLKSTSKYFQI